MGAKNEDHSISKIKKLEFRLTKNDFCRFQYHLRFVSCTSPPQQVSSKRGLPEGMTKSSHVAQSHDLVPHLVQRIQQYVPRDRLDQAANDAGASSQVVEARTPTVCRCRYRRKPRSASSVTLNGSQPLTRSIVERRKWFDVPLNGSGT